MSRKSNSTPVYLFDIDGPLANLSHRLHFIQGEHDDWNAFYDACPADKPHRHMCDLVLRGVRRACATRRSAGYMKISVVP
jgi:hypothetical protein